MQYLRTSSFSDASSNGSSSPTSSTAPTSIPTHVYRVHRPGAQTQYSFRTGFRSKNQTTIVSSTLLLRQFSLAHLNHQTNISSPLISVYDSQAHAEYIAHYFSRKYNEETWVVKVDTRHFARGPVFRAADLLAGREGEMTAEERELHRGEYLIMYRIPAQAIVIETKVGMVEQARWGAVGAIGQPVGV